MGIGILKENKGWFFCLPRVHKSQVVLSFLIKRGNQCVSIFKSSLHGADIKSQYYNCN